MRIHSSDIYLASRVPEAIPDQTRNRQAQAERSYRREAAAATVIDAEYVDLADPANGTRDSGQHSPVASLAAALTSPPISGSKEQRALLAKFQHPQPDVPPPGTYLNVFA